MIGSPFISCAPKTCAACGLRIENEGLALTDSMASRINVHDLKCAKAYRLRREQAAWWPWRTAADGGGEIDALD